MKALIFSSLALVGLLLVALQHQQIGDLRAENATLQQSAAEVNVLKADLAKSTDGQAQDAVDEITRLREENRDLLKLRNEVNQLRDSKEEFQKVNAENQQLQSMVKNALKTEPRPSPTQPIIIRFENLSYQGLHTPEAAVQTFYWAERQGNLDVLSSCVASDDRPRIREFFGNKSEPVVLNDVVSIEIAARRDLDSTTIQLGIQFRYSGNNRKPSKKIITLRLRNGEWQLDTENLL